jgi:hypothetical protein
VEEDARGGPSTAILSCPIRNAPLLTRDRVGTYDS